MAGVSGVDDPSRLPTYRAGDVIDDYEHSSPDERRLFYVERVLPPPDGAGAGPVYRALALGVRPGDRHPDGATPVYLERQLILRWEPPSLLAGIWSVMGVPDGAFSSFGYVYRDGRVEWLDANPNGEAMAAPPFEAALALQNHLWPAYAARYVVGGAAAAPAPRAIDARAPLVRAPVRGGAPRAASARARSSALPLLVAVGALWLFARAR